MMALHWRVQASISYNKKGRELVATRVVVLGRYEDDANYRIMKDFSIIHVLLVPVENHDSSRHKLPAIFNTRNTNLHYTRQCQHKHLTLYSNVSPPITPKTSPSWHRILKNVDFSSFILEKSISNIRTFKCLAFRDDVQGTFQTTKQSSLRSTILYHIQNIGDNCINTTSIAYRA